MAKVAAITMLGALAATPFEWSNVIAAVSLAGMLVTAYVTMRRLPGQQKLDQAQRDSLIAESSATVIEFVNKQLAECRAGREEVQKKLEEKEREIEDLRLWCRRLERALADARIPIPESY